MTYSAITTKASLARAAKEIKRLEELESSYDALAGQARDECREVEEAVALYVAKYKPGARVSYNGAQYEIATVRLTSLKDSAVRYKARMVLNDGTLGKRLRELYIWNKTDLQPFLDKIAKDMK